MKAKEIYQYLLDGAIGIWETTCDGFILGDENKEVKKLATCFKLTAKIVDEAIKNNIDMIITHEPLFSIGDYSEKLPKVDALKKKKLLESGITVCRFHDHCHYTAPDYIHEGFLRSVGLEIETRYERENFAVSRYDLKTPLSPREIGKIVAEKLGNDFVRIVGNIDKPIKTIILGLGGVNFQFINLLFETGADLFITGEAGEVCICEYIRDAEYYGENKSVMLLGHFGSEFAGMRYLAEKLNETVIETVFYEFGEVYNRA